MARICLAAAVISLAAPLGWAQQPAQKLFGLTAPGATEHAQTATAMTPDGKYIVGNTSHGYPYRWSADSGLVVLDWQSGSSVKGISADGNTIVGARNGGPFFWNQRSGVVSLASLLGFECTARGVSADGSLIVGECLRPESIQAFAWRQETGLVAIVAPGWELRLADAVASDGAILGGGQFARNVAQQPYRLLGDRVVAFGAVPGSTSTTPAPGGFSASGQYAVGVTAFDGTLFGFPFVIGPDRVPVVIPVPAGSPPMEGSALQVSDGGTVVGRFSATPYIAFVWSSSAGTTEFKHYLIARDVPGALGASLTEAQLITPDGKTIVGSGTLPGYSGLVVVARLCYANCDDSPAPALLSVADFSCFLQRFSAGDSYANCDGSSTPPVLNIADFTCFLARYASGCQ
jgi:hypothetical protein